MFQQFLNAYIECMLWSSTDDNGDPLDANYSVEDISEELMRQTLEDCKAFYDANHDMIEAGSAARAGHDFWLTRNRHGAGFWDGDWIPESGKRMTEDSHAYGSVDLIVCDDGKIR